MALVFQSLKTFLNTYMRSLLVLLDCTSVALTLAIILILINENITSFDILVFTILYCVTFVIANFVFRIYDASIRHLGVNILLRISFSALLGAFTQSILIFLMKQNISLITPLLSLTYVVVVTVGYRVATREFLFSERQQSATRTLVYGAGDSAIEFVTGAMQGNLINVVGFIDDNREFIGNSYHGRVVFPLEKLDSLITKFRVTVVVVAIPKASRRQRRAVLEKLLLYPVRVLTVPNINEILEGKAHAQETREIDIEDLLGREPVEPIPELLRQNVEGKTVLISGAGGSIGSELARQIVRLSPKKLIILDSNELALFAIEQELVKDHNSTLVPILGSVTDSELVNFLFKQYSIDGVFHAAAYKHVPLVEANPFVAVKNNVLGTTNLLDSAIENNCGFFTLISTDKAVRPTNVMGATKRLAELVCQAAANGISNTKISMVRFGNVLDSSGSAIPIFREQIRQGGPVTITHPEITRFFMTIPEAAQLVLQASSMAQNGDVFLLDMGELVKIADLAVRMIRLSGRTVANNENDQAPGAIKIVYIGLRPGEKLCEELLIDAESQATLHPRIMKAREFFLERKELEPLLSKIYRAVDSRDLDGLKEFLRLAGTGYNTEGDTKIHQGLNGA